MTFSSSLCPLQLLDIAGKLLERPLVAQDVSEKYLLLIQAFIQDLDTVRAIYSQRVQEEAELGRSVTRGFGWRQLWYQEGCNLLLLYLQNGYGGSVIFSKKRKRNLLA